MDNMEPQFQNELNEVFIDLINHKEVPANIGKLINQLSNVAHAMDEMHHSLMFTISNLEWSHDFKELNKYRSDQRTTILLLMDVFHRWNKILQNHLGEI